MREFGPSINAAKRAELTLAIQRLYSQITPKRSVRAADFAMTEQPDLVVAQEVEIRWPDGRLRIAATEPTARPPFEWLYEVTSDVGWADYFKHYLVREDDIVLAQRKVLTPIDAEEAELILHDLTEAARQAGLKDW